MVTLQLRQLDVSPGRCLLLHDVSWSEFEAILEELGNHLNLEQNPSPDLALEMDIPSKSLSRFPSMPV